MASTNKFPQNYEIISTLIYYNFFLVDSINHLLDLYVFY